MLVTNSYRGERSSHFTFFNQFKNYLERQLWFRWWKLRSYVISYSFKFRLLIIRHRLIRYIFRL